MTKFKGTPLFGQDSSPQNTSNILALIGTALLWLTFLICAIFIKPSVKKPKYKKVQIVLSSTSVKEKVKESSAPAQAASEPLPASSETPVAPANEESTLPVQKSSAPAKTESAKTQDSKPSKTQLTKPVEKKVAAPSPAPTEPTIYKSVEELMAEQIVAKKSSSSDFDQWAAMEDDFKENTNETSNTQNTIVNNTTPAFEGTAAQTVAKDEPETSSSSSSSTEKKQTASSGTIKDLSSIKSQTYAGGNAANGIEAEPNVKTTNSGSGKVEMVMFNGSSRALLEPSKPVINLSDAASMTIDGSRKVVIKFRVVESGNVPRAEISITPASILSELVRNEIIDQVSKWRFEAADYSATAEFEYKIVNDKK